MPMIWPGSAPGWSCWAARVRARHGWPGARPGCAPRRPWRHWQRGPQPDEVELPLYTTCARLAAAPPGDGIRRAVVASALGQLPDLGGTRVIDALRVLFEERNAPTLLVADSLDEARGADDRIRQADTLPPAWRIVLTSRPGSWNRQLAIGDDDPSRRVGVLQPLRYPEDVEPFIAALVQRTARVGRGPRSPAPRSPGPAAGRHRAADSGVLLHRRRRPAAAWPPRRLVRQGDPAHAHRPVARQRRPRPGPGRVPGHPSRLGLVCGSQRPGIGSRRLGG